MYLEVLSGILSLENWIKTFLSQFTNLIETENLVNELEIFFDLRFNNQIKIFLKNTVNVDKL